MQLFAPWNLLWLALLAPVIIFFYLLKLKRREVVVSSTLLWSQLVKDVQANAPFQKLKRNLLLLLQLLILLCAILALARPAFFSRSLGGSSVVLVLDGSASMQSKDVRGDRFEEAKRIALKMVGDMRGGDRMMVLLSGARTHRLTNFTSDQNELRSAINKARPTDAETDLRDSLLLAASVAGNTIQGTGPDAQVGQGEASGTRIYVLSDGAFLELQDLDTRGAEVQFVKIGSRGENAGIVAMDVRRGFTNRNSYQMFVAVRNFGKEPRKGALEFYNGEALIDARPVDLPAANPETGFSEKAEVVSNVPAANGILRARLDIKDDLDADNEAYSQLSTRQELKVLLVTEGDLYLEKALNVDPNVQLSVTTPSAYNGQTGFDVVVFENVGPKKVGPGAHLYINCGGSTAPVELKGQVTNASIVDWERAHPVMRFVKLSRLNLAEARTAEKRPWGVVLAEHESGPAIVVGEHDGAKSAYVGFPLLKTEFPLRVAFPIFFNNLVQWLATQPGRTEGLQLRTGEPAPVELPENAGTVTVTDPDGQKHTATAEGRTLFYAETERRGVYQVEGKGFKRQFAVNLLSRDESATAPRDTIRLGRRPILAGAGATRTARETWRWLVLVAVVVLGVEWWVFHRRI